MSLPSVSRHNNQSKRRQYRKIFYSFIFISCLLLLMAPGSGNVYGAQATLAWDRNNDSSVLGYNLYWRTEAQQYALLENVGNSISETVSDLQAGTTYYFVATAYDGQGNESEHSNEVAYTAPADCTYSISPTSQTLTASGGTGTIEVTTEGSCSWTASSGASWMTITSGSSGTGTGTISFTVSANTETVSRTAASTIAGQTLMLTQTGVEPKYTLTTSKSGTGTGTVASNPSGTTFSAGTAVTLTATPGPNSTFTGWSGACSGTSSTCQVTMNSNVSVGASFNAFAYNLTVTKSGNGSGTVATKPSNTTFKPGATVTLTARPSANSTFTGWSGACSGTSTTCKVKMTSNMNVQAGFTLKTYTMSASAGDGGTISPSGITSVTIGSTESYTVTPAEGYKVYRLRVDGRNRTTSSNVYTFSNIKAKHNIVAYFKKQ